MPTPLDVYRCKLAAKLGRLDMRAIPAFGVDDAPIDLDLEATLDTRWRIHADPERRQQQASIEAPGRAGAPPEHGEAQGFEVDKHV